MTTHELLELASLDALGLLDHDERLEFEGGFMAVPPCAPGPDPLRAGPPGLRRGDAARRGCAGRACAPACWPRSARRSRPWAPWRGARFIPTLLPSRGVTPLCAAAVGSVAAAIVLGFTTLQMQTKVREINDLISANVQSDNWVREFGARFETMIYDANTSKVAFSPVGSGERQGRGVPRRRRHRPVPVEGPPQNRHHLRPRADQGRRLAGRAGLHVRLHARGRSSTAPSRTSARAWPARGALL